MPRKEYVCDSNGSGCEIRTRERSNPENSGYLAPKRANNNMKVLLLVCHVEGGLLARMFKASIARVLWEMDAHLFSDENRASECKQLFRQVSNGTGSVCWTENLAAWWPQPRKQRPNGLRWICDGSGCCIKAYEKRSNAGMKKLTHDDEKLMDEVRHA
ncbi:hypothetical protein BS50DRAFT_108885 [Corynespora cassiicola Philippines]|uniref:Uncharacterized protein n=1 Tax=Corynespora cassiicola Philippines TaxID=1448308 RepID=A0A2T2NE08_CORCC|nr:hypothetical protein BS50DRAFT_108885 [Corynespora cassiicola Philippines]